LIPGLSTSGHARLLISAINIGEVYSFLRKHHSASLAAAWREASLAMPASVEVPALDDIWQAATLKALYPISYADAFAAALAQKHNCPLLTGDPEFRRVENLALDWLPQ
jgi:predicted nucleic acid-binding protein